VAGGGFHRQNQTSQHLFNSRESSLAACSVYGIIEKSGFASESQAERSIF
jgi:hypothetical protein